MKGLCFLEHLSFRFLLASLQVHCTLFSKKCKEFFRNL
nr:MAG TPA: hypothetical protein [Caudoviricetes sp.]